MLLYELYLFVKKKLEKLLYLLPVLIVTRLLDRVLDNIITKSIDLSLTLTTTFITTIKEYIQINCVRLIILGIIHTVNIIYIGIVVLCTVLSNIIDFLNAGISVMGRILFL